MGGNFHQIWLLKITFISLNKHLFDLVFAIRYVPLVKPWITFQADKQNITVELL